MLWIVGLLIVVSAGIGVITETVLSNYLVHQLDEKLQAPPSDRNGPTPSHSSWLNRLPPCGADEGPRLGGGNISMNILADGSAGGIITNPTSSPSCSELTDAQVAELRTVPQGTGPVTVTVAGTDYRVAARTVPLVDQNGAATTTVVITGLSMSDVYATQLRLAIIMISVAGGAIILGGVAVYLIVRRSVRPLERVAATARAVTRLPLDKGEVDLSVRVPETDTDRRTEIGQVGSALNQMLGHVSSALQSRHDSEMRVRQFVADASHELRTPLAAIRGYSELAGRGRQDPATVAHALRRVESESERMTSLVEDLLLLARLDSGRPLERQEVDLTALVVDRVSDARVAGPDHRWLLRLPDEPLSVIGDPPRLHQVVANLLSNARTHTPPGTEVVTSLAEQNGMVLLTVADDGPGIPAELQPEVFGRFVRGDSSRSRAAGSTGLGLAIVAAVVGAHGGQVEVHSVPGRTSVQVRLPSAPTTPRRALLPDRQSEDAQTLIAGNGS